MLAAMELGHPAGLRPGEPGTCPRRHMREMRQGLIRNTTQRGPSKSTFATVQVEPSQLAIETSTCVVRSGGSAHTN